MNEVIDSHSGNMNVSTFNAVQTVKYNHQAREKTAMELFRREDVRYGEVDRILCRNIQTIGTRDKHQRQQRSLEKAECRGSHSAAEN